MAVFSNLFACLVALRISHGFIIPFLTLTISALVIVLYRLSPLHPVWHIPGPFYARVTSLALLYHSCVSPTPETIWIQRLHDKYGPVVLIAPSTVDFSDSDALDAIYVAKGGFRKPSTYKNFDPDGKTPVLLSETDHHQWNMRFKAVGACFARARIREMMPDVERMARTMVELMRSLRDSEPWAYVDILGLARSFAADTASTALFGHDFGALDRSQRLKHSKKSFRGDSMLDAYDAFGRYWYLPPWIYKMIDRLRLRFFVDDKVHQSLDVLWGFVNESVDREAALKEASSSTRMDLGWTFPRRLLRAGFSKEETKAQCMDALSAGVETTGFNIAVIAWYLVKQPETYKCLQDEVALLSLRDSMLSHTYLYGVVQEGLRVSKANPTRLPRVVPEGGWVFKNTRLPAGTEVSCTKFQLHFDRDVYNDPEDFQPERWQNATKKMRDHWFPFGLGARGCVARQLALTELCCVVYILAESNVLAEAECVKERLEILQWFNSKVVDGRIDVKWRAS